MRVPPPQLTIVCRGCGRETTVTERRVDTHDSHPLLRTVCMQSGQGYEAPLHEVCWTHDGLLGVRATMVCHAGPDAWCRTHCVVEACQEEGCDQPEKHSRVPQDTCNHLDWMENDDEPVADLYADRESTPVRDAPVTFAWTGHGFEWRYAFPPAAASVGGTAHTRG